MTSADSDASQRPRVSIVVAASENGVIGRNGGLPWHLSADLQRFKRVTMGHPLIMGRRTWESIGRPLPGRTSIVVSRRPDYTTGRPDVPVAGGLDEAIVLAQQFQGGENEVFVVGGADLYAAALPIADRLYFTRVLSTVEGDIYLPEMSWEQWRCISRDEHAADERNDFDVTFEIYQRRE